MKRTTSFFALTVAGLALFVGVFMAHRGRTAWTNSADVQRVTLAGADSQIGLPPIEGASDTSLPLVVIDAGHGGHDPGAENALMKLKEKKLTLALAESVRQALLGGEGHGGIRVALTRSDDHYLALEERSGIARRLHAALFVSIHADSADGPDADTASGATVYTLSQHGSNEEATRIAQSENAADTINGVSLDGASPDVSAILVGLSQRHTAAQSNEFAQLILREGKGHIVFRARPLQSAAFVVLKSPDVPSVLVEAGYISNHADALRLNGAMGRNAFAERMAVAIRAYIARQSGLGIADGAQVKPVQAKSAPTKPATPKPATPKPHVVQQGHGDMLMGAPAPMIR